MEAEIQVRFRYQDSGDRVEVTAWLDWPEAGPQTTIVERGATKREALERALRTLATQLCVD